MNDNNVLDISTGIFIIIFLILGIVVAFEQNKTIENLNKQLKDRDNTIVELNKNIEEKDNTIEKLNEDIKNKDIEIENLKKN